MPKEIFKFLRDFNFEKGPKILFEPKAAPRIHLGWESVTTGRRIQFCTESLREPSRANRISAVLGS